MAFCKAHNDGNQARTVGRSLSITLKPDKILLNCMAGCTIDAVLKSLGLEMKDLFLDDGQQRRPSYSQGATGNIVATYDYHDKAGKLVYQTVKYEPKDFRQRQPDGAGGWINNLKGVERVLYNLPAVLKAAKAGETIWKVEGEKDADNLALLGVTTTTHPMGAASKWRKSYTDSLKGVKEIIICEDNDEAGKKHAAAVALDLSEAGIPVKILDMPRGEIVDISDWLDDGLDREALDAVTSTLPPYMPPPPLPDSTAIPSERYNKTDLGNAERLVDLFGETIRYSFLRKQWLIWSGKEWRWDISGRVTILAHKTARGIYEEAQREKNENEQETLFKHAKSSESSAKLKAMIEQAEPLCAIDMSELDSHPWLLNCLNGTINLQTGELQSHNKDDFLTLTAPVKYDPQAKSEMWEAFLDRIFDENKEVVTYLQRCIGYTLTGETTEQDIYFCWGSGMNGKSTFLTAFREILAPFAIQVSMEMFMTAYKPMQQGHQEDIANLAGKRFVLGSETEEGRRLAVNKLKQMTGGERIRASRKYEKEIEFDVTYKIWLQGNHKPDIPDTTYSIWRRIKLIPFAIRIPEAEEDKLLRYRLRGEYPALLAWAVQGCLDWQREGLGAPPEVVMATEEYRREQDLLADFLEDVCIWAPQAFIGKGELYAAYLEWCTDNGSRPIGQKLFSKRIAERGIFDKKGNHGKRLWLGLRLREPDDVANVALEADSSRNFYKQSLFSNIERAEGSIDNREKFTGNGAPTATYATPSEPGPAKKSKPVGAQDLLSRAEVEKMLNELEGMRIDQVLKLWEESGKPAIQVDQGTKIADLSTFLEKGSVRVDHLGALGDWLRQRRAQ